MHSNKFLSFKVDFMFLAGLVWLLHFEKMSKCSVVVDLQQLVCVPLILHVYSNLVFKTNPSCVQASPCQFCALEHLC